MTQSNVASEAKVATKSRRKKRWRPHLRLRDMFWLSLLAAVLMTWYRDRQALLSQMNESLGRPGVNWSVLQATGAPDTPVPGDQVTAWASETRDDAPEWLILEFPWRSNLAKVEIVETYNPGAVRRICSVSSSGAETELWKGIDPTPTTAAMGRSIIKIPRGTRTRRIKIYLDSKTVPGWNEIDAVALHDVNGSVQWATNAWASSAFGENQDLPRWFWP
ncbi:MAG: hypothetical protein MI861_14125 [Pirellulales bacterium]|nr:hypothetical protein [Pirellulales bacterium]